MGDTKICRYCGKTIYRDAQTCEYCGKYLYKKSNTPQHQKMTCAQCQAPVNEDDNFCQNCGAVFNLIPVDPKPVDLDPVKHNINEIHYNIIILLTSLAVSVTFTSFITAGKNSVLGEKCLFYSIAFVVAEILLYIYFLPSILAIENNKPNVFLVYICNLLLGITVVGWFVALGMAMRSEQER